MRKLGKGRARTISQLRWRLATVFVAMTLMSIVVALAGGTFDPTVPIVAAVVLLAMYAVVVRSMDDWQPREPRFPRNPGAF